MKCPGCSSEVDANSKFCPSCGGKLVSFCAKCGQQLAAGDAFCQSCGHKAGTVPSSPPAPAPVSQQPVQPVAPQQPVQQQSVAPRPPVAAPQQPVYQQPAMVQPNAQVGPGLPGGGMVIVGYVFAFLGGLIGLIIGSHLWRGKAKLASGEKVRKYDQSAQRHGRIIVIISIISMVLQIIIATANQ